MAPAQNLAATPASAGSGPASRAVWQFSLPLIMALLAYIYLLSDPQTALIDGDTYWHIAAGRWILDHGVVPAQDVFSHTMQGRAWTAHEWLSEIILSSVHQMGGWTSLVALTGLAYAATVGLLMRALLRWLEPIYAALFTALAAIMTISHALARPHMLAMPILMLWVIALVVARDENRAPRLWLIPVMTLWANLHGSFTLGIALSAAFAFEALLEAWGDRARVMSTARAWGLFFILSFAAALVTPHGAQGLWFTYEVMVKASFALQLIGEWRSTNFQVFQPLSLWLLAGIALVMHQGLKLPPVRLILLVGLIHLALKHARNIEILGLLGPLVIAAPFGAQWRERRAAKPQLEQADRLLLKLSNPAGPGAILLAAAVVLAVQLWMSTRPMAMSPMITPDAAVRAVEKAGVKGPVLNTYDFGGYLIYSGIAPFIDGRADMYGDEFLKEYVAALDLVESDRFDKLTDKYNISWTLLRPGTPAIALMDHSPRWRRIHADEVAVVHVRLADTTSPTSSR